MNLIIVESPTKAKTISKFVGKHYKVKSSYGHVRDLPTSTMGVDIEHDFTPKYLIPKKAKDKVKELKDLAKNSDVIILATDEDREGEAIAWHLLEALNLAGKKKEKHIERIVFHEITKKAIGEALKKPRFLDMNLVNAQQARRVLDRLVGYELSPFLWKKIKKGLSAGRVQSVALRIICEREKEIKDFKSEKFWTLTEKLNPQNNDNNEENNFLEAELFKINEEKIEKIIKLDLFAGVYKTKKTLIDSQERADKIENDLKTAKHIVKSIVEKETTRHPAPPFTTSTLQQAAINNLSMSAKQTMRLAQQLYEQGFITYMRTDSFNLSAESTASAQKVIQEQFGQEYALEKPRFFKNKSKGAQEAHEAIRPTNPANLPEDLRDKLDPRQWKVYNLIWKRMVASQMAPAKLKSIRVEVEAKNENDANKKDVYLLKATGNTLVFDGFFKVYGKTNENILPEIKEDDELTLNEILKQEKSTTPPPRYSEASLVKILEEYGIGRPSTYAPTISTIMDRNYVEKNEERRLYPLEIGVLVNDLLVEHFKRIVDIGFTAELENDLDSIADGEKKWVPMVKEVYEPFHENLVKKTKEVKKEDVLEKLDRNCPECGGDLLIRFGRFGKFIACSKYPDCKYTEKTEEEKKVDEEVKAQNIRCDKCGSEMVVKHGRYGRFLGCSKYPECKNIQKMENKTGVKCPVCKEGDIVEKKSKRGKMFYACNRYPDCKTAFWSKPNGENCPECQSLLLYAAKGMIKCSSKECKFEKENTENQ